MVGVKNTISTVIVALAVASVVHADMMPLSPLEGESRQPRPICDLTVRPQQNDSGGPAAFVGTIDLDLLPVGFLPVDASGAGQTKPLQVLTDRQNSLTLCLYALLGLGLYRSAPLVKKIHFGHIPDWYHSGGPFQIGHSFAISPDCLPSASVFCFLQPDCKPEDVTPQYSCGAIPALLRQSQFTPTRLTSRGPPSLPAR